MKIRRVTELGGFDPERLRKVNLFESERFFLDLYALLPGQAQRRHAHADEDKVYFVLDGSVRVEIAGEVETLGQGEAVLAPAGSEHGIDNPGPGPALVLAFMAPHPDLRRR